jgi:hypothetical protein
VSEPVEYVVVVHVSDGGHHLAVQEMEERTHHIEVG